MPQDCKNAVDIHSLCYTDAVSVACSKQQQMAWSAPSIVADFLDFSM